MSNYWGWGASQPHVQQAVCIGEANRCPYRGHERRPPGRFHLYRSRLFTLSMYIKYRCLSVIYQINKCFCSTEKLSTHRILFKGNIVITILKIDAQPNKSQETHNNYLVLQKKGHGDKRWNRFSLLEINMFALLFSWGNCLFTAYISKYLEIKFSRN